MTDERKPTTEKVDAETVEQVESLHINNAGSRVSAEKVTTTTFLFSAFIAISATICNFDLSYGGTVLLMRPFNTAFGPCHESPGPAGIPIKLCQITAL